MKSAKETKPIPVVEGSGNVFADLGLLSAEDLHLKAELARQICKRIKAMGLTQVQAAALLGLQQPDVSKLVNGRHTGFSADRLMTLLNALEIDVDIVLRANRNTPGRRGRIRVMEAVR